MADIRTTIVAIDEIGLKQSSVCAILLIHPVSNGSYSVERARPDFGEDTSVILNGLLKISEFSDKKSAVESENYIKLLLSIAEDIMVFIMIAQHLRMMREAKSATSSERLDLCRINLSLCTACPQVGFLYH